MLQNTYSWSLVFETFAQIKYSNLHKCEDMKLKRIQFNRRAKLSTNIKVVLDRYISFRLISFLEIVCRARGAGALFAFR